MSQTKINTNQIDLTSSSITTALGYTPINKAGDTGVGTMYLNNDNFYGAITNGASPTRLIGINTSDQLYIGSRDIAIQQTIFVNNNTQRMQIAAAGEVLVGAQPSTSGFGILQAQSITANIADFSSSFAGNAGLRVRSTNNNNTFLHLQNSGTGTSTTDGFAIGVDSSAVAFITNYENTPLVIQTNGSTKFSIGASGQTFVTGTLNVSAASFTVPAVSARFNDVNTRLGFVIGNSNGHAYLGYNTNPKVSSDVATYDLASQPATQLRFDGNGGAFTFNYADAGTPGADITWLKAGALGAGGLTLGSAQNVTGNSPGEIGMPNAASIRARNGANNAWLSMISVNASDELVLGGLGATADTIFSNNGIGETMRLSAGDLLIGRLSTSGLGRLQVLTTASDTIDFASSIAGQANFRFRNTTANGAFAYFQNASTNTTTTDGFAIGADNTAAGIVNFENTPINFSTSGVLRMSIAGTGRTTFSSDSIAIDTAKTPSSATDTGTAGQICWDANYVYVCTATNTWKRTAIATW